MDKLQELLAAGVDPTRGLQNLVLARFREIGTLRARLRRWEEIAAALDLPVGRAKALRAAYARVGRKVRAGVLEPPAVTPTPMPARPSPATKAAISADAAKSEPATQPARPGFKKIELPN
jgi:hypothetical protein